MVLSTIPARWTRPSGAGKNSGIPRVMPFGWCEGRAVAVDDVGSVTERWFGRVGSRGVPSLPQPLSRPAIHLFPAQSG